jgi:PKHD-type hydroxylase
MLLPIPAVLSADEVATVVRALRQGHFVDGRLTAGAAASEVKQNLELDRDDPTPLKETLARAIVGSLYRHPTFQEAALPHRIATPIFARYQSGMFYGDHVDDPIMGQQEGRYRSDISCTVFLSDPDSYAGGELTIRTSYGVQQFKLAAGDAVIYPSHSLHRVAEVLAAVLWIQSLVRDSSRRELLYELAQARRQLLQQERGSTTCDAVDRSYVNLLRMWAET